MSRIYFHSEHGTAELSGRERAYMGTFCSTLLVASLGLDRSWPSDTILYRRMMPRDHYTQQGDDDSFIRSFKTWLCVGDGTFGIKTQIDPFTAALNTAVAIGGDAVKLMARLHGQCEIHTYVLGQNRSWLASIIARGLELHLLREGQGWDKVITLLRARNDGPVVTSYSVCNTFPNPGVAQWEGEDTDAFYDLPSEDKWARGMKGLKDGRGLEMAPDDWDTFYFGPGTSGFDVYQEATR